MKARAALVAIAVLGVTLVAAPTASADRVSLTITVLSPNVADYTGRVRARKEKCERNRTVQIAQVQPPLFIGQTGTDDKGRYLLEEYAPPKGVQIKAVVLQKRKCKALEKVATTP
jgi:hypothetical protein